MQITNDSSSIENEFSINRIEEEAYQGRYYSVEMHRWETLGSLEWCFRGLLGTLNLVNTTSQTCLRHSWKAIECMEFLPREIEQRIVEIFNASRIRKSTLSNASESISKIYVKLLQKGGAEHFEIQQDRTYRFFRVFENNEMIRRIFSASYGIFRFYNKDNKNLLTNEYDYLFQNNEIIAQTKFYNKFLEQYKIEILIPKNDVMLTLRPEGDEHSFIFRDSSTQKILAIALWEPKPGFYRHNNQDWSLTIVDKENLLSKNITNDILTWALLKHSQQYLLGSSDLPYIDPNIFLNIDSRGTANDA